MEEHLRSTPSSTVSTKQGSRTALYVFGFNAHGQLSKQTKADLRLPRLLSVEAADDIQLCFAGWNQTVVSSNGRLLTSDAALDTWNPISVRGQIKHHFICTFGDHNGLVGVLDDDGQVYIRETPLELVLWSSPNSPKLTHIVLAGNGRVAVALFQQPSSQFAQIAEFSSFQHCKVWLASDLGQDTQAKYHVIPGHIVQLAANATAFACLTEAGNLYTWGDARHRSLGRSVAGQDAVRANEPGPVEALAGIKVAKVSAGGWMMAALSIDGAAYLWGTSAPGTVDQISGLSDLDQAEVLLVEICTNQDRDNEPEDIHDLAVGNGHVAMLTERGELYSAGENRNGQLGHDKDNTCFEKKWQKVRIDTKLQCTAVHAGSKSTYVNIVGKYS